MRPEWLAYVLAGLPGTVLALLAATGIVSERTALVLFAPSFLGLNLAHMAAAWGHAYLDPPGWRSAAVERVAIPALIVIACLTLEAYGWGALLLTAQYWLSIHHAGMQNYGIVRSRGGRGGRVEQAACVLLPLGALAYRARAVCSEYDGAHLPAPPAWLAPLLLILGVVALFAFVVRARKADLLSVALVVGLNLLWSGLLVGLRHPALPLYALASGHYVQQLYFAYQHQRRPALRYLVGATAAGGVVVLLLTSATVGAHALIDAPRLDIPPWVAAMIGVNLWHYWLESRIWRRASGAALPA